MRAWLDCEFNGYKGQLLSMALVAEDGSRFYEVMEPPDYIDPWVAQNVMPIMGDSPRRWPVELAARLSAWLAQYPAVHVIVDWPDDIRYFCEALITGPGECIKHPPLTFAIEPALDCSAAEPRHNALADAFALRADHLKRERA